METAQKPMKIFGLHVLSDESRIFEDNPNNEDYYPFNCDTKKQCKNNGINFCLGKNNLGVLLIPRTENKDGEIQVDYHNCEIYKRGKK